MTWPDNLPMAIISGIQSGTDRLYLCSLAEPRGVGADLHWGLDS